MTASSHAGFVGVELLGLLGKALPDEVPHADDPR